MKRACFLVAFALLVLVITAFSSFGKTHGQAKRQRQIKVATYDARTGEVQNLNKELLGNKFKDGMPITNVRVEKIHGVFFLIAEGAQDDRHRISRTKLRRSKDGSLGILLPVAGSETCSGQGCGSCEFTDHGCRCKNPVGTQSICNHSISRPGSLFSF